MTTVTMDLDTTYILTNDGGNKKFYPKMINHPWHKPELKPSSQS
jgi:hypothetical protein